MPPADRSSLLARIHRKFKSDFLGWTMTTQGNGFPGSWSYEEVDVLVALVYDRASEYSIRCVEYEQESLQHFQSGEWHRSDVDGVFRYGSIGDITVNGLLEYDEQLTAREILEAACAAFASVSETATLVKQEEALDQMTECKNEVFYRREAKPPTEFRFLGGVTAT